MRRIGLAVAAMAVLGAAPSEARAQATFTPVYNAPYRAFESREYGLALSLPDGPADFGLEGQYRLAQGRYDFGIRGGIVDYDGGSDVVLGVDLRWRVIDHVTSDFPLDGALVLGVGTAEFDTWIVPMAGLSLGRRVDLDGFSFVAYGQPTLFLLSGPGDTDLEAGFGLGADFRVGNALDLRVSFGLADAPSGGASFALVWVR